MLNTFMVFKPKQVFLKLDELPYPALRLLFTMLSDKDLASITSTCLTFKQIADPIWKKVRNILIWYSIAIFINFGRHLVGI